MSELVLEVKDVSKHFHDVQALDHVSLGLERGRIYGLVGRNGAGKTTLMRIICGLSHPTSGCVSLFGQTGEAELCRCRARMGCLIESPAVYTRLTVNENMTMRALQKGCYDRDEILRDLDMVGLSNVRDKRVRHLSLGTRQRLGIALALVGRPSLMILDEPTNGLDPVGMADVRALLRTLCDRQGVTLLVSSHILSELYQLADDFVLMDGGRVLEAHTHDELAQMCGPRESLEDYFLARVRGVQS